MPPDGVTKPVDVSGDGVFGLLAGLPGDGPDQLRLDGFEEGLDHCGVVAVPAPAHRDQDATFAKQGLIADRAVLRSRCPATVCLQTVRGAIGMVNQIGRGVASQQSAAQGFHRKIALQTVTRGPANDAPRRAARRGRGRLRGRASPL